MVRFDLVAAIDACYAPLLDDRRWLEGILAALAPLDQGLGCFAQIRRLDPVRGPVIALSVSSPSWLGGERARPGDPGDSAPPFPAELYAARQPVASLTRVAARAGRAEEVRRFLESVGVDDVLAVGCDEPGGGRILVGLGVAPGGHRPPRTVHQLTRLGEHLSAATRLRHALRCAIGGDVPAAILAGEAGSPDARANGRGRDAEPLLADGVRRLDGPTGPLRRSEPGEALEVWRGLVAGTWSLVDGADRGGTRRILARRNRPGVRDPKALTGTERSVAALAALGHQNKLIAWALGISPSAVAVHLHAAERKLKLGSRAELVRLMAPLVRPARR